MTKEHDYGEPWRFEQLNRIDAGIVDRDGNPTDLFGERCEGALYPDDKDAARAVACVNAMAGLDPEKVRRLVKELVTLECQSYEVGPGPMGGMGCGLCAPCNARACFYEEDES